MVYSQPQLIPVLGPSQKVPSREGGSPMGDLFPTPLKDSHGPWLWLASPFNSLHCDSWATFPVVCFCGQR